MLQWAANASHAVPAASRYGGIGTLSASRSDVSMCVALNALCAETREMERLEKIWTPWATCCARRAMRSRVRSRTRIPARAEGSGAGVQSAHMISAHSHDVAVWHSRVSLGVIQPSAYRDVWLRYDATSVSVWLASRPRFGFPLRCTLFCSRGRACLVVVLLHHPPTQHRTPTRFFLSQI